MTENYISDGKNCFLRVETEYDNGYEFKMIHQNQPEMLLSFHPGGLGEGRFLDYHVTGLVSLFSLREQSVSDYLYPVLYSLERLSDVLNAYLLRPEGLLLSPETVFLQRETGQFYFCYVPGRVVKLKQNLTALMEFFMKYAEAGEESDVLLLYGLYQKAREDTTALSTMAEYWRSVHAGSREKAPEEEPVLLSVPEPDEAYEELGLEPVPKKKKLFFSRKEEIPDERPVQKSGPEPIDPPPIPLYELEPEQPDEEKKKPKGKFSEKVKKHLFEIAIVGIIVVGAILFFLT